MHNSSNQEGDQEDFERLTNEDINSQSSEEGSQPFLTFSSAIHQAEPNNNDGGSDSSAQSDHPSYALGPEGQVVLGVLDQRRVVQTFDAQWTNEELANGSVEPEQFQHGGLQVGFAQVLFWRRWLLRNIPKRKTQIPVQ